MQMQVKKGKKAVNWPLTLLPNIPNKITTTVVSKGYVLTLTSENKILAKTQIK